MIKILLIYPPFRLEQQFLYPPYGLLSIAAVLEKSGIQVEILDLCVNRFTFIELKKEISNKDFDIVGMGGMVTVYYYIKFLSKYLKKEYPNIPIIAGGTVCSGSPDVIIRKTEIDVAVIGEAESIIVDLVRSCVDKKSLSSIPGIIYKHKSGLISRTKERERISNLDKLPLPAYHLVDMEKYILNASIYGNKVKGIDRPVVVFSSRGCPFHCTFCYRNFGQKVKRHSVQYVLDHMTFLEKKYNTKSFFFGDEIFVMNKKWVIEFCDRIIKEKRNYVLGSLYLRASYLDEKILLKMKEAGFNIVTVGIESFFNPTLEEMNKGQSRKTIIKAIEAIKKCGLYIPSAQFLFGFKADGIESMKENIKMAKYLGLENINFAIPCPYPGTYLYEMAKDSGQIKDEEEWLFELADRDVSNQIINMSDKTDDELKKIIEYGEDSIRMYFLRKKYFIFGSLLTIVQKIGRKFNIDIYWKIKELKDFFKGKRNRNDVYIKNEVLHLLGRSK